MDSAILDDAQIGGGDEEDDQPEQNAPRALRHLQDCEQRGKDREDQRADDRASVAAAAAKDRRAADNGRRNRGQHERLRERKRCGFDETDIEQTHDAGQDARQHVERQYHLPVFDAGQSCGAFIVAERIEQPAKARAALNEDQ